MTVCASSPRRSTVERHDLLALMTKLKLAGMRAAYDDIMRDGLKRQRSVQQILGDLLSAEVAEKEARSISYQIGAAKLPLAKELTEFEFTGSPVNEALVRDLHGGGFLETQRNAVFVGGTGTGKSHLSIAITANCIRKRNARARFFNVVDLVNRLEAEARAGVAGRLAEQLTRVDLVVLDELGYLPFAQSGGQLLFHLISRLYERTSISSPPISPSPNGPRFRRPEDDHRAARSPHAPLRHRRDRQRKLALQEPRLSFVSNWGFVTSRFGVDHATQVDRRATDDRCRAPGTLSHCSGLWDTGSPTTATT